MSNRRIDNLREPSNVHFRVQTGFPTATDATEGTLSLRYISGLGLCLFAYYANRWSMTKLSPMNAKDETIIENLVVKNLNVDKTAKFNSSKVDISDKNIPKIRKWDKSYVDMRSGEVDVHFKGINSSGILASKEVRSVNDITVGNGTEDAAIQSKGDNNLILKTGNSTTSNITIVDGADGDIQVNTNGSGKLSVGSGSLYGTISSNGDQDLVLQTGNATTGNISIVDGASGAIKLMPNTDGQIAIGNGVQTGKLTTRGTTDLVLSTNSGVNSGTITITDAVNQPITLAPNGTGDVRVNADTLRVGDENADVGITTWGTGDLTLNTNSGTTSGSITIADGADGNISITPNGTGKFVPKNIQATTPIGFGDHTETTIDTTGDLTANYLIGGNKQRIRFAASSVTINTLNLVFPAEVSGNFMLIIKNGQDLDDGSPSTDCAITNWKVYHTSVSGANAGEEADVIWHGGSSKKPTISIAGNRVDIISFYWDAEEEICYGQAGIGFY